MRSGKSIFYLACAFFGGWVLSPVWEWMVGKFLDRANKLPGGVTQEIGRVIAVTAPAHPFLLGVSVGMLLALLIGYWPQVRDRLRRYLQWSRGILHLLRFRGQMKVAMGTFRIAPDEPFREITFPDVALKMWDSKVHWWPQNAPVVCQIQTPTSFTAFRQRSADRSELIITYEVWGSRDFWKTLAQWRKTDLVGQLIRLRDFDKARANEPPLPEANLPPQEP